MKLYLFFVCAFIHFACSNSPVEENQDVIYRVEFARASTCWPSPYEAMSMDSSMTAQYHGVAFVDTYGYHNANFTLGVWQTLQYKCKPLLRLKSDTCWNSQDAEKLELIIYSNRGVQHFSGESHCLDDSISLFCNWLVGQQKYLEFEPTSEFTLETRAQNSYDGLPRDPNSPYAQPESSDTSFQFTIPEF